MNGRAGSVLGVREQVDVVHAADRWWARLAFVLAAAAVVVLLTGAEFQSIWLVLLGAAGLAVAAAAVWWFLTARGRLRSVLAATVAVTTPVLVLVVYAVAGVLLGGLLTLAVGGVARLAGRGGPGPRGTSA